MQGSQTSSNSTYSIHYSCPLGRWVLKYRWFSFFFSFENVHFNWIIGFSGTCDVFFLPRAKSTGRCRRCFVAEFFQVYIVFLVVAKKGSLNTSQTEHDASDRGTYMSMWKESVHCLQGASPDRKYNYILPPPPNSEPCLFQWGISMYSMCPQCLWTHIVPIVHQEWWCLFLCINYDCCFLGLRICGVRLARGGSAGSRTDEWGLVGWAEHQGTLRYDSISKNINVIQLLLLLQLLL